jgi:hypothetical protein
MYRFGDGTPFPIQENFIDTLLAAVDACVGAFGAAAELDDRREKTRIARKEAEEELRRLAVMDKAIETAVAPMKPSVDKMASTSQQAASRALAAARSAIAQSKQTVDGRLQQLAGEPRLDRSNERLRLAMAQFFERHQLPETQWDLAWTWNGARAIGDAIASSGRFHATFELQLAPPWTGVVRIGSIAPGLDVLAPKKKAFGGWKRARVSLDKAGIVAVERSAERHTMTIRSHAAKPSPGWFIQLEGDERSVVTVVPVDLTLRPCGPEIVLDGDEAAPLHTLWAAIEAQMLETLDEARTLRDLAIGDATLDTITDPAMVARAILGVVGPVVRQVRQRSRVPGELAIKRDVGDGRREELYVPRDVIERKFAPLPQGYRRPFEDIGLGRAPTAEIVSTDDAVTMPEPPPREVKRASPPPPPSPTVHVSREAHIPTPPPAAPPLPLASGSLPGMPTTKEVPPAIAKAADGKGAAILAKLPKVPPTIPGNGRVPLPIDDDSHSGGVAA